IGKPADVEEALGEHHAEDHGQRQRNNDRLVVPLGLAGPEVLEGPAIQTGDEQGNEGDISHVVQVGPFAQGQVLQDVVDGDDEHGPVVKALDHGAGGIFTVEQNFVPDNDGNLYGAGGAHPNEPISRGIGRQLQGSDKVPMFDRPLRIRQLVAQGQVLEDAVVAHQVDVQVIQYRVGDFHEPVGLAAGIAEMKAQPPDRAVVALVEDLGRIERRGVVGGQEFACGEGAGGIFQVLDAGANGLLVQMAFQQDYVGLAGLATGAAQ